MAHKAPGKHHREGISLMKLFKMFPDDATADKVVCKNSLARRHALPTLRVGQRAVGCGAQEHALSLS